MKTGEKLSATAKMATPVYHKRGRRMRIRSKMSGLEGWAFPDDPHVYVEGTAGQGLSGWYRRETLDRDFLKVDE